MFASFLGAIRADIDRQVGWAKDEVQRQTRYATLTGVLAAMAALAALGAIIIGLIALYLWLSMQADPFIALAVIGGGLLLLAVLLFLLAFVRRHPRLAARPRLQIAQPAALLGTLRPTSYRKIVAGGDPALKLATETVRQGSRSALLGTLVLVAVVGLITGRRLQLSRRANYRLTALSGSRNIDSRLPGKKSARERMAMSSMMHSVGPTRDLLVAWWGKGLIRVLLLLIAAAVLAAIVAAFGIARDYGYLSASILTGSADGYYHSLATRLADRAKRKHGSLTVIPTAGSMENAGRLANRGGGCTEKFALIQDGTPVSRDGGLELLGRLPEPESLLLLGRPDHAFPTFAALRGASIGIGPKGSGTAYLMHQLFEDPDLRGLDARLSNHGLQE
jgi:hypothetical protein